MAVPKVLAILRLFTTSAPRWRVERIAQELAISPSTAYRCVAELVRAGFLEPVAGGHYVLGPAFIDYDLRMRQGDPLLRAAAPQMAELGAALGPTATVFLTRYYRDCVMFVHIERGRSTPPTHERGHQISLFSAAATARAVLQALPDRVLRGLYQRHPLEIGEAGLGKTPREFRAEVKRLRVAGWVHGPTVNVPDRVGIAAAVVYDGVVRGSLGAALPAPLAEREIEQIGSHLFKEANRIAAQLTADAPDVPRLLSRRGSAMPPPPPAPTPPVASFS